MALTTFMRSWQDFEYVTLAQLPMFLFSGDVLPGHRLPRRAAVGRRGDPALPRRGAVPRAHHRRADRWDSAVSVVYLWRWALVGLVVVRRRLDTLLLT